MKTFLFAVLLLLVFAFPPCVMAQTRVLLGGQGGDGHGVLQFGLTGSVEIPIVPRIETDLQIEYSPYYRHAPFGTGYAWEARQHGILWLNRTAGLVGGIEINQYHVEIHKTGYNGLAGLMFRHSWSNVPTRIEFLYVRQVMNKFEAGIESSYLQGGRVVVSSRLGCSSHVCYRLGWEFEGGRILEQSNPLCDGTLPGRITCPRNAAATGGVKANFVMEFPRRKQIENEAF